MTPPSESRLRSRGPFRALAYASALGAGTIVVILLSASLGGASGLSAAVGAALLLIALFAVPCALAVLLLAALPTRASTRRYRVLVGAIAVPAIGFVALLVAASMTAPPVGSQPTPGPPLDPVPTTLAFLAFGALVGVIGAWPDDLPRHRARTAAEVDAMAEWLYGTDTGDLDATARLLATQLGEQGETRESSFRGGDYYLWHLGLSTAWLQHNRELDVDLAQPDFPDCRLLLYVSNAADEPGWDQVAASAGLRRLR